MSRKPGRRSVCPALAIFNDTVTSCQVLVAVKPTAFDSYGSGSLGGVSMNRLPYTLPPRERTHAE